LKTGGKHKFLVGEERERDTNCAWKVARDGVTTAFVEFESHRIDAGEGAEEGVGVVGGLVDVDCAFGVEEERCVCVLLICKGG